MSASFREVEPFEQINALNLKVLELQERCSKLERSNKRLSDEKTALIAKIQNHANYEQELQAQVTELRKLIEGLEGQFGAVIKENQELETRNSELEERNKDLEDHTRRLQEENDENMRESLELKRSIQEDEKRNLLARDEKKQYIQFLETKTEEKDFKNFYDCRIAIESFFSLLQPDGKWPVEYKNWEEYQKHNETTASKLAVLGYENAGKSWLISNLMGVKVPQGKHTRTTGVCVLYPTDEKTSWIALDTPGTNVSVKVEALKERMKDYFAERNLGEYDILRMLYGDNILIEKLLQEFVVDSAELLLVVVGKLKRDDQRLISRIKTLPGKRVLIIHNLMETKDPSDVKQIIKEDIIDTFNAGAREVYIEEKEQQHDLNRTIYFEKENTKIEHLVFAHEGSQAGKYYNETSLSHIKKIMKVTPKPAHFELVEFFEKHFKMQISNYFSTDLEAPSLLLEKDEEKPVGFKLDFPGDYELKYGLANEFGQIRIFDKKGIDLVPFTVKIFDKDDQRYLQIEFEIVGTCEKKNLKFEYPGTDTDFRVVISGKSEDNIVMPEEYQKDPILENSRKFGKFRIETEMIHTEPYSIFKGVLPEYDDTSIPGLKILTWELEPDSDKIE